MPNADELQRRLEFYGRMAKLRACQLETSGPFLTVEEMILEDRKR